MKKGTLETPKGTVQGLFCNTLSRLGAGLQLGHLCEGLLLAIAILSRPTLQAAAL